jgi:glutathione S-transferase
MQVTSFCLLNKYETLMPHPYMYSLQHCPYAMRARLGLLMAQQKVMVRAITLNNKPPEMLALSKKGTVPIMVVDSAGSAELTVIDESLDIMLWALNISDPHNLLYKEAPHVLEEMLALIKKNDDEFIVILEKYKHASRYYDFSQLYYRRQCEVFIAKLEQALQKQDYFFGATASLADYALLPFVRQFARVNRKWYLQAPYPKLRDWLNRHLQQGVFTKAMAKFPLWTDNHEAFLLGGQG